MTSETLMKISLKIFFVPLLMTLLVACGDNDNDEVNNDPGNIAEVASDNGSFTTLLNALEVTGLDAVLTDESRSFTVFAPTDAAFDKLDPAVLTALLNDPDALSDILLYHVIADAEINSVTAIAAAGTTLTTANTDDIGISFNGSDLLINASTVIIPNVDANNGIIHAIDTILIPTVDDPMSGNIAEVATANGSFTTLLNALAASGLDMVLADTDSKFTVFAPTDAAFAAFGDISGLSNEALTDILLYHVISDREINASALSAIAGNTVTATNDDELAVSLSGADLFLNLSQAIIPDVDASNGIIHVIDSVLLPPAEAGTSSLNIVETALANPGLSTLVAALQAAGLDSVLADPAGSFTVFAPTNAAFDALGAGAVDVLLGDIPTLTSILTKHVVSGSVDSITAFTLNGANVATVNGETVSLGIMAGGEFLVDDSVVTTFDVRTTNGIIHIIDAVIALD
jgi:transforming growth factor-beta-induced protein